jgi:hypothetical protein
MTPLCWGLHQTQAPVARKSPSFCGPNGTGKGLQIRGRTRLPGLPKSIDRRRELPESEDTHTEVHLPRRKPDKEGCPFSWGAIGTPAAMTTIQWGGSPGQPLDFLIHQLGPTKKA